MRIFDLVDVPCDYWCGSISTKRTNAMISTTKVRIHLGPYNWVNRPIKGRWTCAILVVIFMMGTYVLPETLILHTEVASTVVTRPSEKNNRVHWIEVLWKRLIESEGLRYSENMTAFYSNMTGNGSKGCAYPKSWPFLSHFGSIIWRNRWEVLCRPMVSAGENHTVLLRSDGIAVACGANHDGQCNFPRLDDGMLYTKVSAESYHSILLRSDGIAVACGMNKHGQCNIPCLEDGMTYTQVSAGGSHTVLLRSDGIAVACGNPAHGRNIPSLDDTMTYTQVSARSESHCTS